MEQQVALLAIGTEITTGQIIDSNSSWISDTLVNMGYEISCHISVPDTTQEIVSALEFTSKHSNLTITTGGLGPTNDDITRTAIASFLNKDLLFHEASWNQIIQIMSNAGLKTAESNRQQCYFPEGSEIFENIHGTANAFLTGNNHHKIICLPGPPSEIKSLFSSHLGKLFAKLNQNNDQLILRRWHVLGKSEADLGEIVEDAIKGSTLSSGYRPHMPYVEVKIWGLHSKEDTNISYLKQLDEALQPWTICKDDHDISLALLEQFSSFQNIHIRDYGTQGVLTKRLHEAFSPKADQIDFKLRLETFHGECDIQEPKATNHNQFCGVIYPVSKDNKWKVIWTFAGKRIEHVLCSPFPKFRSPKRKYAYVSEISIIDAVKTLTP